MEIQEMILRIPGMSEREGRLLAEAVSQGLTQQIGEGLNGGHIGSLDLRIQVAGEQSRQQLAQQIIQAITQQLPTR